MPPKEKQTYPEPRRRPLPEWMGKTCLAFPPQRCENIGQTIRPKSTKIRKKNFFRNVLFCTHRISRTPITTSLQRKNTCKKLPIFDQIRPNHKKEPEKAKKTAFFFAIHPINKIQQMLQKTPYMPQKHSSIGNNLLTRPPAS
ncbi:hypothetical protein EZS27_025577 [termite gut metagenome]|uniref:Uncharacterized protein n=1 Tax=termite gut metagenome TaxID=433724 RepID=A0A5J4QWD5_9ZZZZ